MATGYFNSNVQSQYLEKESIQYWSLGRLEEMLKAGGVYRREIFRASFIPTVAVVVKLFSDYLFSKSLVLKI